MSSGDQPAANLTDESVVELVERRLSDNVRDRVEHSLQWRYGTILAVALAVAGFFGYDTIQDVKTAAQDRLDQANTELDTLTMRVGEAEVIVETVENLRERVQELNPQARSIAALQEQLRTLENSLAVAAARNEAFIQTQASIIAEGVGQFLGDTQPEVTHFYQAVREFSRT